MIFANGVLGERNNQRIFETIHLQLGEWELSGYLMSTRIECHGVAYPTNWKIESSDDSGKDCVRTDSTKMTLVLGKSTSLKRIDVIKGGMLLDRP